MKNFPGRLSISSVNSNEPPHNWVSISLIDESSGCHVAQIDLSYQQLGEALTGRGQVPCDFYLGAVEKVGKIYEHKSEEVLIPYKGFNRERFKKAAAKSIKVFEIDGWIGRAEDAENHYHRVREEKGGYVYRIGFVRYV